MPSSNKSIKKPVERSFTINNVYHIDGCPTKFTHHDYSGRYESDRAIRAASKALTKLCGVKRIRGQCTLYIEMRETTAGSSKKLYAYHCKRIHLTKPLALNNFSVYYKNNIKPVKRVPTEECKKSHKTSGRMIGYQSKLRTSHNSDARNYKSKHTKKTSKHNSLTNKISNSIKKIFK